jgi:hypothetical protein
MGWQQHRRLRARERRDAVKGVQGAADLAQSGRRRGTRLGIHSKTGVSAKPASHHPGRVTSQRRLPGYLPCGSEALSVSTTWS